MKKTTTKKKTGMFETIVEKQSRIINEACKAAGVPTDTPTLLRSRIEGIMLSNEVLREHNKILEKKIMRLEQELNYEKGRD